MRALVVFESMYGNTHLIADRIADGLRPHFDVTVVSVGDATLELVSGSDVIVVGGPTHAHGLSSRSSRRTAAEAAKKPGSGLILDASASGPMLRDWLHTLDGRGRAAAAFDTRAHAPAALTGRASRGVGRRLRHRGYRLAAHPMSFFVDRHNRLLDGEAERAKSWGGELAASVSTVLGSRVG